MINFKNISDIFIILLSGAGSVILGYVLSLLFFLIYNYASRHLPFSDLAPRHLRSFLAGLISIFAFSVVAPIIHFHNINTPAILARVVIILYILIFAFGAIKFSYILEEVILRKHKLSTPDNLSSRKIYTQVSYLKKIIIIAIFLIAISIILMQFKPVKDVGTTIIASAGVIGIILGFAAQKSLNLFMAGLRVAFTQPIRIDDVLVVNGEWGRVEEISLTYVVFRIWDLRRLIIPVSYFIENPFENWTRFSANLLGTVFIYTDYKIDVEDIRNELLNILKESDLWDNQAWGLQVTDSTDKSLQLRALLSASDSSKLWDLRCLVREKLIKYIGEKYPGSLPRVRNEIQKD